MNTVTDPQARSTPALPIERKLAQAWSRERGYFHLRGLARLAPWLVGLFLFDLLLDWWLDLPATARLSLLLGNLAVLGWLGYRHWLQYLRRFDSTRVALQVERLHPGLNNLLVSYVQLNGGPHQSHGSPQLIEAMRRQAVGVLGPLDFRGIVNFRNLRWLLGLAGGVLLLFAVSGLFAGEYYRVLLVRMLNPSTELAYPTRTRIEGISDDLAVKEGDPVSVWAEAGGEVPEQGTLHVKFGDASWEEMVLTRGEKPVFTFQVGKAAQSFVYYFKIGDARSKRRGVTVVHPPRIVRAEVELHFPKYIGRPAEEHPSLQLPSLPEGTEVRWKLRCDQPLAGAQVSRSAAVCSRSCGSGVFIHFSACSRAAFAALGRPRPCSARARYSRTTGSSASGNSFRASSCRPARHSTAPRHCVIAIAD